MAEPKPQNLTIVSCTITPKPIANPRDEMTEFDVTVKIGEFGTPFRLRTDRGMPLKPLYFGGATVEWITDLLTVGAEISAPIAQIGSRWQTPADGYLPGDRGVNLKEIKSVGRKIVVADPRVARSTPHITPVPGTIEFNDDGKMGRRAV